MSKNKCKTVTNFIISAQSYLAPTHVCVDTRVSTGVDTFKNHLASTAVVGNYVVSTKIMRAESHISGTMVTLNSVVALVGIWCFIHSKKMTFVGW